MKCLYLIFVFLGQLVGNRLDIGLINKGLWSYYNLCPKNSCHTNTTTNTNSTLLLPECMYCRCSVDCIKYGDCCPDVLLNTTTRRCNNGTILFPAQNNANKFKRYLYKMVNDCPFNTTGVTSTLCTKERNTAELMTSVPVTSLDTFLTYKNEYCSQCHGEVGNYETWQLDTLCKRATDFNFLNSATEIEKHAMNNNCGILYRYDNFAERCLSNTQVVINKCNQTGTLINMNLEIENACLYIDQPYGIYRNIFCYICNPLTRPLDEISTCSSDNQTQFSNLCLNSPSNDLTYPYKNQYCYLCNIDETTEVISDIHYDMNITGKGFIAYIFTLYCKEDFKLGTYDINSNNPMGNETEDTLPLRNNSDNTTNQNMIYSRPWQYHVSCPQMEIFSKFYTVQQLKSQALASKCIFEKSASDPLLKCFKKEQLIRKCNVEGYLNYVNPLFETGCLYLEDASLIAYNGYYNAFCYMCNSYWGLYKICFNEYFITVFNLDVAKCYTPEYGSTIQNIWCKLCSEPKGGGFGYRPMFTLSSYKETISQLKEEDCIKNQLFDYRSNLCRDLCCSPGKVLKNSTCLPLLQTTTKLFYILTSGITVSMTVSQNVTGNYHLKDVYTQLKNHFWKRLNNEFVQFQMFYFISDTNCKSSLNFSGIFYLQFNLNGKVSRRQTEETLLNILYFTNDISLNNVTFSFHRNDQAFYAPIIANNFAFSDRCVYYSSDFFGTNAFIPAHVNDLLLCDQVELNEHEYKRVENQQIKLDFNNYILGPNDYLVVHKGNLRVCSDKYEQIMNFYEQKKLDTTLFVLSSICSAISILCLASTFITYALFSILRTVPGENNMCLAFALMISEILIQVRLYDLNENTICKVFGVLSHYFILSVFMSFNVCTFHLYRVFTCSLAQISTGKNLRSKYRLYSFAVPALVVACNLITTYLVERSIGYGGDSCFLILRTAAIVTLHCPIGIILLANTFMFITAIRQISNSPNVSSESSTREKRKDIVIFMKLFTITGCTWIFQFIDAFFPASIFSVLTTFCNLLSGIYIFISYICNRRVAMLYKNKLLRRQKENESQNGSKCVRSSTTLYRVSSSTSTGSKE